MDIKTKYKVGEQVEFIKRDKKYIGVITVIMVNIFTEASIELIKIEYHIRTGTGLNDRELYVSEKDILKSVLSITN